MADFASNFIQGYSVGQQTRLRKEDERRTREQEGFIKKQQEWAAEDRDIEKQLLQQRIRELKIGERLQARAAAREDFQTMTGTPVKDLTPDQTEGGVLPATSAVPGMEDTLRTRMKSVDIPGIEELGIPGISRRPQTQEQQQGSLLEALLKKAEIESRFETRNVPEGSVETRGGREIFRNPRRDSFVPFTERGVGGRETTEWIPESERAGRTAVREPLPVRPSTVVVTPNIDIDDIVGAIRSGDRPYDLSGYPARDRPRIDARLAREGFNTSRATADQAAVLSSARSMNGATINKLRVDADATLAALNDLEALNEEWNNNWGALSWAGLMAAKGGASGDAGRAMAGDIEAAVAAVREGIGLIKSGGSAPTVRVLEEAERALSPSQSKTSLAATIRRLRTNIGYRVGAIRSLEPLTGQGAGGTTGGAATGGGSGRVIYDMDGNEVTQ